MPVHSEIRNCKKCSAPFEQIVKQGRPFTVCLQCRPTKKEKAATV